MTHSLFFVWAQRWDWTFLFFNFFFSSILPTTCSQCFENHLKSLILQHWERSKLRFCQLNPNAPNFFWPNSTSTRITKYLILGDVGFNFWKRWKFKYETILVIFKHCACCVRIKIRGQNIYALFQVILLLPPTQSVLTLNQDFKRKSLSLGCSVSQLRWWWWHAWCYFPWPYLLLLPCPLLLEEEENKGKASRVEISQENLEFSQQWPYIKELEEIYPLALFSWTIAASTQVY